MAAVVGAVQEKVEQGMEALGLRHDGSATDVTVQHSASNLISRTACQSQQVHLHAAGIDANMISFLMLLPTPWACSQRVCTRSEA